LVSDYKKENLLGLVSNDAGFKRRIKEAAAIRGVTLVDYCLEAIEKQAAKGASQNPGTLITKNKLPDNGERLGPHKKRESVEMIGDILRLGEVSKTRIRYLVGMNHFQVGVYLDFLTEREFLERIEIGNGGVRCRTTKKGTKLLETLDKIMNLLTS